MLFVVHNSLGNTAPFHITQPSTDYDVQIVSPTATMVNLTCSLNVTIPVYVQILWIHIVHNNKHEIMSKRKQQLKDDKTATLLVKNLQPSDAGIYQCVFNDQAGSGWTLRRNIQVCIIGKFVYEAVTILMFMYS